MLQNSVLVCILEHILDVSNHFQHLKSLSFPVLEEKELGRSFFEEVLGSNPTSLTKCIILRKTIAQIIDYLSLGRCSDNYVNNLKKFLPSSSFSVNGSTGLC